jgi:amino acid permease
MVGSEMLGSTAGESSNPARDVPKAAKQVVWRILFVFILGIILQGMIVPYDDPELLNGASPTARAIIAIAMARGN